MNIRFAAVPLLVWATACVELESTSQEITTESGACKVVYTTSDWDTGFTATVRVTNKSSAKSSWSLRWSYSAGQRVGSIWNATSTQSGASVTASPAGWNAQLATGATVEFGFNGTKGATNPAPAQFFLDGVSCGTGGGGGGGGGGTSGFGSLVSRSLFESMFPTRNPFYTYDGLVAAAATFSTFSGEGDTTTRKREAAAFLANVGHETGDLVYVE